MIFHITSETEKNEKLSSTNAVFSDKKLKNIYAKILKSNLSTSTEYL